MFPSVDDAVLVCKVEEIEVEPAVVGDTDVCVSVVDNGVDVTVSNVIEWVVSNATLLVMLVNKANNGATRQW